jgi:tetratricopeptide (TPR) repeat protein
MPLGIELAATWADTLSLREIADEIENSLDILEAELRDLPDSQNSMRASFARSWNLLNDAQQTAFRKLSVFRGGFTRHAAEAVAGVGLRALQALASKSLLRYNPDSGRYEVHELLRQYAQEKLESSGEASDVYTMYASYFADFMAERWPKLKGQKQPIALQEIEADIENVRAAWRYWIKEKNVSKLRQFLHSLWVIYDVRGWYRAGVELFEQGVGVARGINTEEAQAVLGWLLAAQGLYCVPGGVYSLTGGTKGGYALAQQGIQIVERLNGYEEMMIVPLMSLFVTASLKNEGQIAAAAAQDCLDVAARIGDGWAIAKARQLLTIEAIKRADYVTAERLVYEALATFENSGDKWSESVLCIEVMGLLTLNQHQFDRVKQWIERGLQAAETIDFRYSQQMAYWQLGYVAALQERYSEAAKYWRKALEAGGDNPVAQIIIGFLGSGKEWG